MHNSQIWWNFLQYLLWYFAAATALCTHSAYFIWHYFLWQKISKVLILQKIILLKIDFTEKKYSWCGFLRGPHFCRLLCDADKTIEAWQHLYWTETMENQCQSCGDWIRMELIQNGALINPVQSSGKSVSTSAHTEPLYQSPVPVYS